jgi:hypothetical protein
MHLREGSRLDETALNRPKLQKRIWLKDQGSFCAIPQTIILVQWLRPFNMGCYVLRMSCFSRAQNGLKYIENMQR